MKKFLACLAALVLLMTSFALADVQVEPVLVDYTVTLCTETNNYIARLDDGYHLFDADGNVLSAAYSSLVNYKGGLYLQVYDNSNTKDLNYRGLLDAQGKLILPMQYGDFEFLEPDWVLAYVLGPATRRGRIQGFQGQQVHHHPHGRAVQGQAHRQPGP